MKRVEEDGDWTLFCPSKAHARLSMTHGEDFEIEYLDMEAQGLGVAKLRARVLWREVVVSLIETGGPSILFKDSINRECPILDTASRGADEGTRIQKSPTRGTSGALPRLTFARRSPSTAKNTPRPSAI